MMPTCCDQPMRPSGMGGAAFVCNKCERYCGPRGARTPAQWWRRETGGRSAWQHALGEVYAPDPSDHGHTDDDAVTASQCQGCGSPQRLKYLDCTMRCTACRSKIGLDPIDNARSVAIATGIDVEIDGVKLSALLVEDENQRREIWDGYRFTPAQRAAISAHWSAQLRARVSGAR